MSKFRLTIWGLMCSVVLFAITFAALINPSESMAGIIFSLTVGTLLFVTVGAFARQGNGRLPWLGFGVFGLGYLVFGILSGSIKPFNDLPTTSVLDQLSRVVIPGPVSLKSCNDSYEPLERIYFAQIGHSLFALLVGLIGSVLARMFRVDYDGPNASNQSGATP